MKHENLGKNQKYNITVTVNAQELAAIDAYLQPLCGRRGPFIKKLVLAKVGYTPQPESLVGKRGQGTAGGT